MHHLLSSLLDHRSKAQPLLHFHCPRTRSHCRKHTPHTTNDHHRPPRQHTIAQCPCKAAQYGCLLGSRHPVHPVTGFGRVLTRTNTQPCSDCTRIPLATHQLQDAPIPKSCRNGKQRHGAHQMGASLHHCQPIPVEDLWMSCT